MNKQNLWFLTLFSLVLVLGVYYVTMPNDLLKEEKKKTSKVTIKEKTLDVFESMREEKKENREKEIKTLQEKLTDDKTTSEEKNNAYEELKSLNALEGKEEKLEKKIKEKLNLNCFVKKDNTNNCEVVCISNKHDNVLANNIMRLVQEENTEKMYTTVKFKKK